MIRALILAGGLGTRSENPRLPKILQELGPGEDLLGRHLKSLLSAGVYDISLLAGHGADQITSRVLDLSKNWPELNVSVIPDRVPQGGTLTPVLDAVNNGEEDDFVFILGDTAIGADFAHLIDQWKSSNKRCGICLHPNLHPQDSDVMVFNSQLGRPSFHAKKLTKPIAAGVPRAITGIGFFHRSAAQWFGESGDDITKALVEAALARNQLHSINTSFYLRDTGTPARLESAREDYKAGVIDRSSRFGRGAIFLDRDGTLVPDTGTHRRSIDSADVWVETIDAVREANESGVPVFIITNQPGVAKGHISEHDVFVAQGQLEDIFRQGGALINDFCFCPHHPDKGFDGEVPALKIDCDCRKPAAGMAFALAAQHGVDLRKSVVIGDTSRDELLASECGAEYFYASHEVVNSVSNQIREATRRCVDDHH